MSGSGSDIIDTCDWKGECINYAIKNKKLGIIKWSTSIIDGTIEFKTIVSMEYEEDDDEVGDDDIHMSKIVSIEGDVSQSKKGAEKSAAKKFYQYLLDLENNSFSSNLEGFYINIIYFYFIIFSFPLQLRVYIVGNVKKK